MARESHLGRGLHNLRTDHATRRGYVWLRMQFEGDDHLLQHWTLYTVHQADYRDGRAVGKHGISGTNCQRHTQRGADAQWFTEMHQAFEHVNPIDADAAVVDLRVKLEHFSHLSNERG